MGSSACRHLQEIIEKNKLTVISTLMVLDVFYMF